MSRRRRAAGVTICTGSALMNSAPTPTPMTAEFVTPRSPRGNAGAGEEMNPLTPEEAATSTPPATNDRTRLAPLGKTGRWTRGRQHAVRSAVSGTTSRETPATAYAAT